MFKCEQLWLSRFEVRPDCSVELSPLGLKFLKGIFKKYDKVSFTYLTVYFILRRITLFKDGDGALSTSEQQVSS